MKKRTHISAKGQNCNIVVIFLEDALSRSACPMRIATRGVLYGRRSSLQAQVGGISVWISIFSSPLAKAALHTHLSTCEERKIRVAVCVCIHRNGFSELLARSKSNPRL